MNRLASVVTVFSVLLINGCGGGSADFNSGDNPTSNSLSTFDGTWSNGCEYSQSLGTADLFSLKINGSAAILDLKTYNNDSCSGTPTGTSSTAFNISYPGQIALSDCFNGQKINTSITFPVTINEVSFTQEQFEALNTTNQIGTGIIAKYDLLCTNQAGTILYAGEKTSGSGISDDTRPTRADLTSGIERAL